MGLSAGRGGVGGGFGEELASFQRLWAGLTDPWILGIHGGVGGDGWLERGTWRNAREGGHSLPFWPVFHPVCLPRWAPQGRELGTPKPSFPGYFKDTAGLLGWQESLSGLTLGMRPCPRASPGMYPVLQGCSALSCLAPSPLCSGSWPSFFLRESRPRIPWIGRPEPTAAALYETKCVTSVVYVTDALADLGGAPHHGAFGLEEVFGCTRMCPCSDPAVIGSTSKSPLWTSISLG